MGEPEESVEDLYDNAPCGYLSMRSDGTIFRVNRTFLSWTGYTREELLGQRRLHDLLTVGGKVYFETHVHPLLQMQGAVNEVQLELRRADGSTVPVLINTTRRAQEGQPPIYRCTLFDITDRKRYERELLLAREAAEQRARHIALRAEVGRALTRGAGLAEQLRLCVEALVEQLELIEVRLWRRELEALELTRAGVAPNDERPSSPPQRERSALEEVTPRILAGAQLAPGPDEAWLAREGVRACALLPLIAGGRTLGVLAAYGREPISGEVKLALVTTGQELAVAIDKARAERALHESRELLETTLRSIGDGVIATDAQERITFLNPVAEQLLGLSASAALHRPLGEVLRLVNEATRQEIESPVRRALQERAVVSLAQHTVLIRHDGVERAVDDSAAPIVGPGGETLGAVLVFRDVTSQRLAQRELATTQQRLSTLVENVPVILFLLDAEGRILLSQGKGLTMLGIHDLASRIGLSALEVYSGTGWLVKELRRALAGEAFVGGGELSGFIFETHYTPTVDERGAPAGTVGLAIDVTERQRYEETIRKTVEFEQQLVGIVSHDLRNPISAILLSATLLLRKADSLDDQALRTVTRIQTSAERAQRLIRDLLDFTQARLGSGIPLERAHVDLAEVVRQALDELEVAHAERTISLEAHGGFEGEWDADRLSQVLTNLVGNALKYSAPDTPVRVTLRDEGERVSLEVHNEGPPIPSESLGLLFLPMRRATSAIDNASRSVGLGLFIVKQLVEAHRGEIVVHSQAGAGTTFRVLLPRHPGSTPPPMPRASVR